MRHHPPFLLAAPAALLGLPFAARAQDGARAPVVAETPGGTRAAAMAGAVVGVRDDEALWTNPAEMAASGQNAQQPRGANASWARTGNATLRGVGAVFQSGRLGIGVGARQLDFEGATLPLSAAAVGLDGARPVTSATFVVGAAREVKGVRLGGTVSYGEDRAADRTAGTTMLDLGVARTIERWWLPRGALHVGLAVQNIGTGPRIDGVRLRAPTMATLGANLEGWSRGTFDLSGGAAVSVSRAGRVIPRAGGEIAWVWIDGYAVAARAGVRRPEWDGQSAVTLGAAFVRDNLSLDYAFEPAGDLPASHRIGVSVR